LPTATIFAIALLNFFTPAHHSFRAYQIDIMPFWRQWNQVEILKSLVAQRGW